MIGAEILAAGNIKGKQGTSDKAKLSADFLFNAAVLLRQ